MRFTRWMGHNGVMEMMAVQLGLAMIPRWVRSASRLISGTMSGTAGSMRNAEELSMTVAPARTAMGANFFEMALPAENSAMSTPSKLASVSSCTRSGAPRNVSSLPAERAEAYSRSEASGKARRSRHPIISTPTAPVAPTIATTGGLPRRSALMPALSVNPS